MDYLPLASSQLPACHGVRDMIGRSYCAIAVVNQVNKSLLSNRPRVVKTAALDGLWLMLAVFTFNLLGDGLRDIVDPRKRT